MTNFEHELYTNNLSKDAYNKTWWDLVKKYQGIVPPNRVEKSIVMQHLKHI
jgi:peptidyl-dipeptidase A